RAELLPHLTSYYNQCVGDSLLRLSDIAAADTDLLNELARDSLKSITLSESESEWVLDAAALARLPLALRRRVLRAAIETVRGDLRDVSMEATERVLNALASERSEIVSLPFREIDRVDVALDKPTIRIRRLTAAAQALPWRYLLEVPGELALPNAALVLETRRGNSPAKATGMSASGQNLLIFNLQEISLPLTVRSWKSGDRMRPRGLGGTKKLQDIFTDRKIRGEERMRFPILVDAAGKVLAIIGVQADETALSLPKEPQENTDSGDYLFLIWK
ncbi:MAG: tRNA(Ile)-lysidine synthetase, N-terminal domain/tRNA(Ile)-lysidine synthetase, C-terminal domain, partial [Chthonomonadales bacterium]|nr:tRNA(Ile)-lysidine synthetase, N-terminal domain/tRNA(Ile)-lysidine synthetase, C-terminal domain [Chthonomonadales bacterium]